MKLFDELGYVSSDVFKHLGAVANAMDKSDEELQTIADLIRLNVLTCIAHTGSGHTGGSMSICELLTSIYFVSMNFSPEKRDMDRDIFVLSKGHTVPALYATLAAKGYFENDKLNTFRRWGGLQGHSDISTNGVEANTGSLSMGLSKAVGHAIYKKRFGYKGDVAVIVGDGELQEGQIWEGILNAVNYSCANLYIIIDLNQIQTDQYVQDIVKYNDLFSMFSAFGCNVYECDATCVANIVKAFDVLRGKNSAAPHVLLAHTKKGQGIDFMENEAIMHSEKDRYIWHNKAPNNEELIRCTELILERNELLLKKNNIETNIMPIISVPLSINGKNVMGDSITTGFAEQLVLSAQDNSKIVVFDADLESDCGLSDFRQRYPERFFEMGIMEQHMVSAASSFAMNGYIPVINSYSAFLTSRSNEQIYNLATEKKKFLIAGHMSGVLPATPGKSHSAYRDISCMKNIPNLVMYQPINKSDCEEILQRYFAGDIGPQVYLRLSMGRSKAPIGGKLLHGKIGDISIIKKGADVILLSAGPVMIGECVEAAKILNEQGIDAEVINNPWLVDYSSDSLKYLKEKNKAIIVVEDHYYKGGMYESLLAEASRQEVTLSKVKSVAIKEITQSGFREESLELNGLSAKHIIQVVTKMQKEL